jgi:hypothetical protein
VYVGESLDASATVALRVTPLVDIRVTVKVHGGMFLTVDPETKVAENKLRRAADRQGLRLEKSRSRDPRAIDYGLFALIDIRKGEAINPPIAGRWTCSWTLDDVEKYLTRPIGE